MPDNPDNPDNKAPSLETVLVQALAAAGRNERLRSSAFDALRDAELACDEPAAFRKDVRWPLVKALLSDVEFHCVTLESGVVFEVSPASRIEQALLLSTEKHPDHVWEPQTTRLLVRLAAGAEHVIVGGAYIGDQILPIAHALSAHSPVGVIHAFEPMEYARDRLLRNVELNGITNVVVRNTGLWDRSNMALTVTGPPALGSPAETSGSYNESAETTQSISIDDYVQIERLQSVRLIMLDIEGGEEKALLGARELLSRPVGAAPHLVFEIHRQYVDWTNGLPQTSIIKFLTQIGYTAFAIRDFHDNYPMANRPIEVIPLDRIYLKGPPHGFNLLATKDSELPNRLGLRVVHDVSPKLLLDKDPVLHGPTEGASFRADSSTLQR